MRHRANRKSGDCARTDCPRGPRQRRVDCNGFEVKQRHLFAKGAIGDENDKRDDERTQREWRDELQAADAIVISQLQRDHNRACRERVTYISSIRESKQDNRLRSIREDSLMIVNRHTREQGSTSSSHLRQAQQGQRQE